MVVHHNHSHMKVQKFNHTSIMYHLFGSLSVVLGMVLEASNVNVSEKRHSGGTQFHTVRRSRALLLDLGHLANTSNIL